jgi:tetratricopeptide (TPR) repeat protein
MGMVLGCSSLPIAHPQPALLASADAELLQGCYDCLLEARASYRHLAVGAERPRVIARVFEADLLIALREKELGLSPSDALADARRIASALPRDLEAEHYVALVERIPSNELGMSAREIRSFRTAHQALPGAFDAERAWLAKGKLRAPVRDYLRRALDCAYPATGNTTRPAGSGAQPHARLPASPLLSYRAAICGFDLISALSAVRDREPRFIESAFFIASIEMALSAGDGPGQARAHLTEALARFPASTAILYLTASYHQLVENYPEALLIYDRMLAVQPANNPARLGRLMCLSKLDRAQEAIDEATRVLELGDDNRADAYYWRAHNHRALGQLAEARRDISAAKESSTTPDVLRLAGIIEYEQRDLDPAEADLTAAIGAAGVDCTARWYLALVHRQRKRWLISGHAFEDAMGCFRDRARGSAERLRTLQARADLDPVYRANAVASFEASIEGDTRQQHLAALIAANDDATGGDVASARPLIELASEDPALAERAAKLRDWLSKPRPVPK